MNNSDSGVGTAFRLHFLHAAAEVSTRIGSFYTPLIRNRSGCASPQRGAA
jgi:hypothetical protein